MSISQQVLKPTTPCSSRDRLHPDSYSRVGLLAINDRAGQLFHSKSTRPIIRSGSTRRAADRVNRRNPKDRVLESRQKWAVVRQGLVSSGRGSKHGFLRLIDSIVPRRIAWRKCLPLAGRNVRRQKRRLLGAGRGFRAELEGHAEADAGCCGIPSPTADAARGQPPDHRRPSQARGKRI